MCRYQTPINKCIASPSGSERLPELICEYKITNRLQFQKKPKGCVRFLMEAYSRACWTSLISPKWYVHTVAHKATTLLFPPHRILIEQNCNAGKREPKMDGEKVWPKQKEVKEGSNLDLAQKARRFMIYVHSKLLIVDDEVTSTPPSF